MRYRIICNGTWYKVQVRRHLFWWLDLGLDCINSEYKLGIKMYYSTKRDAIEMAHRYRDHGGKKWKVVHHG